MKKTTLLLLLSSTLLYSGSNMSILNGNEDSDTAAVELKGNGEYCRLWFASNGKIDKGSCRFMVNSRGLKIYCTPGKKMCKTYDEIYAFVFGTNSKNDLASDKAAYGQPKVGQSVNGGFFLYRERVEMYWNDWLAYPLTGRKGPYTGQVNLTISGEGKTTSFNGVLSINCQNGRYFWKGHIPQYAVDEVPNAVYKSAVSLFCR